MRLRTPFAIAAGIRGLCALLAAPALRGLQSQTRTIAPNVFFGENGIACTGVNPDHTAAGDTASAGDPRLHRARTLHVHTFDRPGIHWPASRSVERCDADAVISVDDENGIPDQFSLDVEGRDWLGLAQAVAPVTNHDRVRGARQSFALRRQSWQSPDGRERSQLTLIEGVCSESRIATSTSISSVVNWPTSRNGQDLVPTPEPASLMLLGIWPGCTSCLVLSPQAAGNRRSILRVEAFRTTGRLPLGTEPQLPRPLPGSFPSPEHCRAEGLL